MAVDLKPHCLHLLNSARSAPSTRTNHGDLKRALERLEAASDAIATRFLNTAVNWPVWSQDAAVLNQLANSVAQATNNLQNADHQLKSIGSSRQPLREEVATGLIEGADSCRVALISAWREVDPELPSVDELDKADTGEPPARTLLRQLQQRVDGTETSQRATEVTIHNLRSFIGEQIAQVKAGLDERAALEGQKLQELVRLKVAEQSSGIADATKEAQNKIDALGQTLTNAKEIEAQIKEVAGKSGVAAYASNFSTAAVKHRSHGMRWLACSVGLAVVLIALAVLSPLVWPIDANDSVKLAQVVAAKLAVLATLSSALAVTLRNHRRSIHNAIVNEHRANALTSFEAFVAASKDNDTKDQVLLQATQMIYSHRDTGYDGDSGDVRPLAEQALEISKSLAAKG